MYAKCPECGVTYNTKNAHACAPKPKVEPFLPPNPDPTGGAVIGPCARADPHRKAQGPGRDQVSGGAQ